MNFASNEKELWFRVRGLVLVLDIGLGSGLRLRLGSRVYGLGD